MQYPVILNGDHAEFEAEHANAAPKERPDWPLPSFDAKDWAEAFCKIAKTHGHDIDEGWMITWFANALMRGFDECTARHSKEIKALQRIEVCAQEVVNECSPDLPPSLGSMASLADAVHSAWKQRL